MIEAAFPKASDGENAFCIMLYDWQRTLGGELLTLSEKLYDFFGQKPGSVIGNCDDKKSIGKYSRIKNRLDSFLECDCQLVDFEIQSETQSNDGLFPSNMMCAFGIQKKKLNKGIVAIRGVSSKDYKQTVLDVYKGYLNRFGLFYGAAFNFPARFGPSCYLVGFGSTPSGLSSLNNPDYTSRVNQWRRVVSAGEANLREGYFREIYQFNFITEKHLNQPFEGRRLVNLMENYGDIIDLNKDLPQFLWIVDPSKHNEVSNILESSGLVLSARF